MIDGLFAYAFTTGMLATVNPCGFAMLPAYLSYFLGIEIGRRAAGDDGDGDGARRRGRRRERRRVARLPAGVRRHRRASCGPAATS